MLLGHSFGSVVGLAVAEARPDLLHAYVGMGQLIDFRENERVGMQELVRHEFVDDDPLVQRSVFADGTAVTCDFHTQTYRITDCPHR